MPGAASYTKYLAHPAEPFSSRHNNRLLTFEISLKNRRWMKRYIGRPGVSPTNLLEQPAAEPKISLRRWAQHKLLPGSHCH